MPKVDLSNKNADWVDCEECKGKGCAYCQFRGSFLILRRK